MNEQGALFVSWCSERGLRIKKNRYYCWHKQRKIQERYTNTVSAWFNLLGDRLEHANTSEQVTETFRKKITKTKSLSILQGLKPNR